MLELDQHLLVGLFSFINYFCLSVWNFKSGKSSPPADKTKKSPPLLLAVYHFHTDQSRIILREWPLPCEYYTSSFLLLLPLLLLLLFLLLHVLHLLLFFSFFCLFISTFPSIQYTSGGSVWCALRRHTELRIEFPQHTVSHRSSVGIRQTA